MSFFWASGRVSAPRRQQASGSDVGVFLVPRSTDHRIRPALTN